MFSKFISVGDKIELQAVARENDEQPGIPGKVYNSTVYDIQSEDTIEITMPMESKRTVSVPCQDH